MWVRLKEREITDILLIPVLLAAQSFGLGGRTGRTRLIVRFLGGAGTDDAREGEGQTDYRRL